MTADPTFEYATVAKIFLSPFQFPYASSRIVVRKLVVIVSTHVGDVHNLRGLNVVCKNRSQERRAKHHC